jgi:hypothetical protein
MSPPELGHTTANPTASYPHIRVRWLVRLGKADNSIRGMPDLEASALQPANFLGSSRSYSFLRKINFRAAARMAQCPKSGRIR